MISTDVSSTNRIVADVTSTSSVEVLVEVGLSVEARAVGIVRRGNGRLGSRDESGNESKRGVAVVGTGVGVGAVVLQMATHQFRAAMIRKCTNESTSGESDLREGLGAVVVFCEETSCSASTYRD